VCFRVNGVAAAGVVIASQPQERRMSHPPHCPSRRRFAAALPALGLLALTGCAGFGGPQSVTLSEAELARLIARRFPATQRVAEIADVTISSPRVWLIPERNRLGSTFDVSAAERLFGRALQGTLSMDCALRFEPADDSLRLAQVRVQQFQLDGGGGLLAPQAQRIGALLAERVLEDMAVYRLKPQQAERLRAAGLRAGAVTVTSRGVELALAPR